MPFAHEGESMRQSFNAEIASLPMILSQVGAPLEAIGLIMGINAILDMSETASNCPGDISMTVTVARTEGLPDERVLRAGMLFHGRMSCGSAYLVERGSMDRREYQEEDAVMIVLNVTYKCKPEMREEFLEMIMAEGIDRACRAETGNIKYDYYIPVEDDDDLFLREKWRDADALAEHGRQPHLARLKEIKAEYVIDTIVEKYIVE